LIYYSNTHEWINDITGEFGLSQHALDLLGDLVYLEVPFPGALVQQLDEIGVIESVKAASDIFSPVTGKVIWTNEEAIDDPTIIDGETPLLKIEFDIIDLKELSDMELLDD